MPAADAYPLETVLEEFRDQVLNVLAEQQNEITALRESIQAGGSIASPAIDQILEKVRRNSKVRDDLDRRIRKIKVMRVG